MFLSSFDGVTFVLPLLEDENEDKVPEMHAKKNTNAFSATGGNFVVGLERKSLSVERAANLEEKLLTVCHLVVMGKIKRLSHYGDSVTCASLFLA